MSPSSVWLLPTLWFCGWIGLRWLAIRWGDQGLAKAIGFSYGLRSLLAIALYAISFWHWPILTSLQYGHYGGEPGFWVFGLDSHLYDTYGALIAQAWAQGTEVPNPELGFEYFALVAAIYRLLGANPLYPILLNCWLGAFTGLLAFRIGQRLFNPRVARGAALLVSYWPSSLLWSAQLLKDSLSWALVFSALGLVLRLAFDPRPRHRKGLVVWMLQWIGLVVTVLLMTRLRFYLGSALSLAAGLILVPRGCVLWRRRLKGASLLTGSVAVVIVVSTVVARTLDPLTLLSPRHPEIGHRRLAMVHMQEDRFQEAALEFTRAIQLNQKDKASYLGLASLHVQAGHLEDALKVYLSYLGHAEPKEQALVQHTVAQLHVQLADQALEQERIAEAIAGYERALILDPSVLPAFTDLSLLLVERGELDLASEFIEKAKPLSVKVADRYRLDLIRQRLTLKQQLLAEVARIEMVRQHLAEEREQFLRTQEELRLKQAWLAEHVPASELQQQALKAEGLEVDQEILKRDQISARLKENRLDLELRSAEASTQHGSTTWQWETIVGLAVSALPLQLEQAPSALASRISLETFRRETFRQGLGGLTEAAMDTVAESAPQELAFRRQGFVAAGGYSLTDARAQISTPAGLLTYLPKALLNGLFAPFPWQWFDVKGSTGMMRLLAGLEMLAWYLVFPAVLVGGWRILTSRRADQLFLLTVVVSLLIPMALVVANLGTLYRLRLLFLLPLLIIAASGDPRSRYEAFVQRVKIYRARRMANIPERVLGEPVTVPTNGGSLRR